MNSDTNVISYSFTETLQFHLQHLLEHCSNKVMRLGDLNSHQIVSLVQLNADKIAKTAKRRKVKNLNCKPNSCGVEYQRSEHTKYFPMQ